MDDTFFTIEQCDREHAVQLLQCRLDTVSFDQSQHDFGVRGAPPFDGAATFEITFQFSEIVNFTIVDTEESPIR